MDRDRDRKDLWNGVKANRQALDGCDRHSFTIDLDPDQTLGKRWKCDRCGGTIDNLAKLWYELGQKHGAVKDLSSP